ncbi:serine/threonine protein kinase [Lujinxingia litoralis]|uniref:serine/threonine protein kinase n=1 Tax=Lujinxingia litoralis TaxID=2211119 RepID=UPI0013146065|nr:protein kinase [Lujinxingia litoralis]
MRSLGPYRLIERIGVGGMAEVYLADAMRSGGLVQPCVVKLLHRNLARDQSFTRMLLEEAKLIASLRHNNISSLYDVGAEDGNFFLVMEYVNGRDLHAILAESARRGRALPVEAALYIAREVCKGLHFAHTRAGADGRPLQLVHRDISPQNILLSVLGEVKIIDFGIAKFDSRLREHTRAGVIKGKFGYMSPEQAWDEPLDHRSDLFSVAICLYEMLSGRSVYGQSDDPITMLKRARQAEIRPLGEWRSDLPDELLAVLKKALSHKREHRFQDAHAFGQALTSVLAGIAPRYTGLESGTLIREFFDEKDPALEALSPSRSPGSRRRDPRAQTTRKAPPRIEPQEIEEHTAPMQEVPDEVRLSGAYAQVPAESAGADDATYVKTVPADFAHEKTELFDEARLSGAHGVISPDEVRDSPRRPARDMRAPSASGSGPVATYQDAWGDDGPGELEPETNPHHRSPGRSGAQAHYNSEASDAAPPYENARGAAARQPGHATYATPTPVAASSPTSEQSDASAFALNRRSQIALGIVLVLIALGFLAMRFL